MKKLRDIQGPSNTTNTFRWGQYGILVRTYYYYFIYFFPVECRFIDCRLNVFLIKNFYIMVIDPCR